MEWSWQRIPSEYMVTGVKLCRQGLSRAHRVCRLLCQLERQGTRSVRILHRQVLLHSVPGRRAGDREAADKQHCH